MYQKESHHSHNCPPESIRYGFEERTFAPSFRKIYGWREEYNSWKQDFLSNNLFDNVTLNQWDFFVMNLCKMMKRNFPNVWIDSDTWIHITDGFEFHECFRFRDVRFNYLFTYCKEENMFNTEFVEDKSESTWRDEESSLQ